MFGYIVRRLVADPRLSKEDIPIRALGMRCQMVNGFPRDLRDHELSQINRAREQALVAPTSMKRQISPPPLKVSDECPSQRKRLFEEAKSPIYSDQIMSELHAVQLVEGESVSFFQ